MLIRIHPRIMLVLVERLVVYRMGVLGLGEWYMLVIAIQYIQYGRPLYKILYLLDGLYNMRSRWCVYVLIEGMVCMVLD